MLTPLYPEFNHAVLAIVNRLLPNGFDRTDDETEVNSFKKLKAIYKETGRIRVWTGRSDQTIFGDPMVNHVFRAWHYLIHCEFGYTFNRVDEHRVKRVQQAQMQDYLTTYTLATPPTMKFFKAILECEIGEQTDYYWRTKEFIPNQREFLQEYLRNVHK